MRNFLLIIVLLTFSSLSAFAQHEADNWYFGDNAGITFRNGKVDSLGGGKITTREGCSSVSDKTTGALLFYTDGVTVWNNQHQIMKNGTGLKGGISSTQGALIVPNPTNILQYYIFTVPDLSDGNPITTTACYYSIVSLETPAGEVVSINNFLIDSVAEKLTGTIDCSGTGFWVVTHSVTNSIFYTFHVTSSGIDKIPVVSTYPSEIKGFAGGCMKISPNNSKLALASLWDRDINLISYLCLFDFDALTGKISNYLRLSNDIFQDSLFYGVSFSPDNTKLYAPGGTFTIFQFELNLPTPQLIRNSRYALTVSSENNQTLQLARDGKIYVAQTWINSGSSFIGVIDKPNLKGSACDVKSDAVKISGKCRSGLPNFMDYIFNSSTIAYGPLSGCAAPIPATLPDSGCIGEPLVFTDRSTFRPTNRKWTFENGTPSSSADSIVTVTFTESGTHKVGLTVTNDKGSNTIYTEAIVFPLPTAKAGLDKTVCLGVSTQLGAPPEAGNTYAWQPPTNLDNASKANPTVTPTANGTTQYILTATSKNGCIAYDTVLVTAGSITAKVSNDTAVCIGSSTQLLASGGSDYEWTPITGLDNPNIPNPIATPSVTTTYKVRVSSGSTCEDFDSVTVTVNPYPIANAGIDLSSCRGESLQLGGTPETGNTYSWQPATGLDDPTKSNPNATPTATTEYILTVTNGTGCSTKDTVLVTVGNIKAIVSNDTAVCSGSSVRLYASGGSAYKWVPSTGLDNPNSATPLCTVSSKTEYKVVVSSGFCVDSAYTTVDIVSPPTSNAGQDQTLCEGEATQLGTLPEGGNTYNWQPVTGLDNPTISNPIATPIKTTQYILTVINSTGCTSRDTVVITVNPRNEYSFTLSPSVVTIIPGQQFQTVLNVPSGVQSWKVHLDYDDLIVKFGSIVQMSNGISATANEKNGTLSLTGTGENGTVTLNFYTFLPYTSDTTFAMKLAVDSASISPCETVTFKGNTLELGMFCGRKIRTVSSTGKNFFLTTKENGVNFGVGLSGNVRLELYDYTGTLKEVLANENMEAGEYSIDFNLPVGVYFCRINSGMFTDVQKMIVVE